MSLSEAARLLLEAARGGGLVVLAGPGLLRLLAPGLPEPPAPCPRPGWRECGGLVDWGLRAAGEAAAGLRRLAAVARRIIYLGVDGAASRLLGDRVLEPYGSVLRGRCGCGARAPVEGGPGSWRPPRCPRGCGDPVPDAEPLGAPPRRRVLREAVYEATTAQALLACCLGGDVLGETLALAASRFARLIVAGRDPIASWARGGLRLPASALPEALEALGDRAPVDEERGQGEEQG